jgi:hypothetical protein
MDMDLITFWNLMQDNLIKDQILVDVYERVHKCNQLLHDQSTLNYIKRIANKIEEVPVIQPPLALVPSTR